MSRQHSTPPTSARPAAPEPLPIAVVDNHAHIDMGRRGEPAPDVAALLSEARAVGVDRVVHIGCSPDEAEAAVLLADEHPALLAGVALHPNETPALAAAGELDAAIDRIGELAAHPRVRTVGESGLDYYRTGPEGRDAQHHSFRRHIALAKQLDLPLQIHDREAHDDVLRILEQEGAPRETVFHCFSGGPAMARECVAKGYYLSFSGTVTFKNARDLRDALSVTPLEQLLVETDAPYLAPMPHRGAGNAPYLMPHTVRAMADVLNISVPQLAEAVSANAERLYGPW